MVHFVGAGPGAPDLITLRGKKFIEEADVIIYAGSLVNPQLLNYAKKGCEIHDSSKLNLEEVIDIFKNAENNSLDVVRLHTGDPSIYGAIREQMDELEKLHIDYDVTPGVSSFCGAAAALNMEYTLPGITQSVIITRMDGRTPVPEKESIEELSKHGATMVFFLSSGDAGRLQERLIKSGVSNDTPCGVVYKATWEDEDKFTCSLKELPDKMNEHGIRKTALIIVGKSVAQSGYEKSRLYAADFSTEYRKGIDA
ncbi:precorrin-4 C(11)-methyltransferase [Butyrivibrio sp. INlla16]|uniref:precorrin-4 C(11)-methyltransferase n=1 Tax=Butyrivibrio sp. INlla16 TaxID=1520807 RepID=UPI00088DD11A|nr:precorrin-4 C(11)-methyltransferase [Butyrivibrio sp. INlla16]SDB22442.1 precorrin-4/cobalt-precorrin-4 C11-methyltransferase [Butyrivibrio sp. INlla16]